MTELAVDNWDWQEDAACRGMGTWLFFGPDGERARAREAREARAKAVCAVCPVRTECLSFGITESVKYGIHGGLNGDEKVAERRRRSRRLNAVSAQAQG
jgi:WhiB family transcriptional regulator, redox-sensing transcriptional regulator